MATTAYCITNPATTTNVYTFPKENNTNLAPNDHDNNNNNHVRARAYAWEKVKDAYQDVLGRPMPRFVEREITGLLHAGVELDMVLAVIEYTACAPRPSWAYARTVLIRNEERGIRTASDFVSALGARGRAGDDQLPF